MEYPGRVSAKRNSTGQAFNWAGWASGAARARGAGRASLRSASFEVKGKEHGVNQIQISKSKIQMSKKTERIITKARRDENTKREGQRGNVKFQNPKGMGQKAEGVSSRQ